MIVNPKLIGLVLLTVLANTSWAGDLPNFFVAPISTELHRASVPSGVGAYAVVNCNALIADDDLDLSTLDGDGFVSALSNATANRGAVLLVCRYQSFSDAEAELRKRLKQHLKDLCYSAGYEKVKVSVTATSADWKDTYQLAAATNQPNKAREPLIENEHVRVFPVQTQLSKFIHGKADCIIEVVHPVDGRMNEIPPDLESSIRQAVQQAALTKKHLVMFKLTSTSAGKEKVQLLFSSRAAPKIPETANAELRKIFEARAAEYKPSPGLLLAQNLGFQNTLYSLSSGRGAPETLVGSEAPDFKLARLSGDQLNLHDFIKGRPALITFWGLACGPCRKEAPYLTELAAKYREEFSIVAVNAYNDEREDVAKYATNEKLTHPIVLQGRTVSDDLYQVGQYPTTFWVDRDGTVIDYEFGFTSRKRLEDRIEKMLKR